MLKYKRILLKLSGEALMGDSQSSVDHAAVDFILEQIISVIKLGVQVGIVIGGGNFFRGVSGSERLGIQRANADFMGMLATVMNGILLRDAFINKGIDTNLYSAFGVANMVKGYNRDSVLSDLEHNKTVIFVGGTGHPYFTTDSGAALRAIETNCEVLIKATKVDGVYDKDPHKFDNAIRYAELTFEQAIEQKLGIMDMSAFTLCSENNMPIKVCSIFKPDSLKRIILGKDEGTLVSNRKLIL